MRTVKSVLSHSNYQKLSIDDTLGFSPKQSSTSGPCQKMACNNAVNERMRKGGGEEGRKSLICPSTLLYVLALIIKRIVNGGFLEHVCAKPHQRNALRSGTQ